MSCNAGALTGGGHGLKKRNGCPTFALTWGFFVRRLRRLTCYSMGGYGVYRTFYETPGRFRALAIFSGDPSLGPRSLGDQAPDFSEQGRLAPFRNVPMFIFHGGRDRNCPIEHTRELIDKLKAAGAKVEFHYEADKGHEAPSAQTRQAFHSWLDAVWSK